MRASFGRGSGLALLQGARCRVLWALANGPPGTQARSRSGQAVRNYRTSSASSAGAPGAPGGGAGLGCRHATALVDGSARVHDTALVGPYAVILEGVTVGPGSIIEGHCVIGPHVFVGPQCRISSHVTVSHATLECHVVLWPGVRIGQDGFGIHKYFI
jgi:NDP-sugar pyrophosphorylase family protein